MKHYYRTGSHSKTDLRVHLVWITKYRKKVLVGAVALRTREIVREIAAQLDIYILSGKVARDHVHVFISYKPDQSISEIMRYFKGKSANILFREFEHLRKQFTGGHFWARGFFAVSSGNVNKDEI